MNLSIRDKNDAIGEYLLAIELIKFVSTSISRFPISSSSYRKHSAFIIIGLASSFSCTYSCFFTLSIKYWKSVSVSLKLFP